MNDYPDFSSHGYQIVEANGRNPLLGHNSIGGRVTYLAVNTKTQQPVVIKQFQFAQLGANWGEYDAIEQEIKVLRLLAHPSIPRYLDFFQTAGGFCMVQEYKDAESAATSRSLSPQEIKQVAISVLEILVYLQSMKPPVIHRDIKPENILIDGQMKVYLVDFGFARMGGGEVAASSVVKGSLGFMPPEQLFNRQLTKASDLYGLGATLICLLTGTKSADIGNLIDERYGIHFQHLVPPQERGWLNWLEKMVEPRPQDRYANAAEALAALKPLDVSRLPQVRVSRDKVEFTAVKLGDKVTKFITVRNPIPETVLAGRWEVAPHESDPPHTPYDHAWISFEPVKFEGNEAMCEITVDTSQLLADETYTRQVLLRTNSQPDTHPIAIEVKTAPLPTPKRTPYLSWVQLGFMLFFVFAGWQLVSLLNVATENILLFITAGLFAGFVAAQKIMIGKATGAEVNEDGVLIGASNGAMLGEFFVFLSLLDDIQINLLIKTGLALGGVAIGAFLGAFLGALIGAAKVRKIWLVLGGVAIGAFGLAEIVGWSAIIFLIGAGMFCFLLAILCCRTVMGIVNAMIKEDLYRGFYPKYTKDAVAVAFLSLGFSISLGAASVLLFKLASQLPFVEPLEMAVAGGMAIAGLAATAIPLLNLIVFKRSRIIAEYRKSEPDLIKP
ncbi:MAG: protein kinase [Oscillatoria princeps RMCB-10]|jgi:serine/threonine protein kinase|nr:protein kinase [Oscillatoria princeps RMCB-10]